MAVPDLPVTVSNAAGSALPYHLPSICPNLKAIAVVPSIIFIAHKPEESHVYWCHSKLEGLEVQAKVLPETMKYLETYKIVSD